MPAPLERKIRNREHDAKRRTEQPWRLWYKLPRWQAIRTQQLGAHPLCAMCASEGRVTAANVCDHVEKHEGDATRFWAGPFQSLCEHHHNSAKQHAERGRVQVVGEDGWPI